MRYRICHRTTYTYPTSVFESFNEVRLQPLVSATQAVLDFDLRIEPPATVIAFRDYYGNSVHDFGVAYLHERLLIEASSEVVTSTAADEPLVPEAVSQPEAAIELRALAEDSAVQDELAEFVAASPYVALGPEAGAIAAELLAAAPAATALDFVERAVVEIRRRLDYQVGTTTVHSSIAEVLDVGSGVCQDFAHVLIAICRHAGLPARYVSGYLGGVPRAEASHAWAEVFVPPYGWLGIDATHDTHCTGQHVKTSIGRDYGDVAVLRGTYKGATGAELDVEVISTTVENEASVVGAPNATAEPHGRVMSIQNLGAMRRFQQGAVLVQAMGGMRQVLGDELPLPPPRMQTPVRDDTPSQQPYQQQQGEARR
jgi:transglutaminase-like putative cysteine protease